MPQSLAQIVLHLVFSTKKRYPLIGATVRPDLHAYLASAVRSANCGCPRVGGTSDHIHLAIQLSRTITVADLVEQVKTSSCKWMKTQGPPLAEFAWQRGYGVFSMSEAGLPALLSYIAGQEEHHRKLSFQEEYRDLLRNHGVDFDERYVWD